MDFGQQAELFSEQPITKQLLDDLLKDYKRPYDKVHELVKAGKLIAVKRGVYIPGPALGVKPPELMLLANHLLGPSYVSFESALSYWGLIPEQVFEITSATTLRSKIYRTRVGRFSYTHLPLPYYTFGINSHELTKKQFILIASPEKAICDKLIATSGLLLRSPGQAKEWLLEDLRVNRGDLVNLDTSRIREWIEAAPKEQSIQMLIKAILNL